MQRVRRLGDVMCTVAKRLGISDRQRRSKLDEAWSNVVGPEASVHSRALSVKNNVLAVAVDSSVWKQEIGTLRESEIVTSLQEVDTGHCIRKLKVELAGPAIFSQHRADEG